MCESPSVCAEPRLILFVMEQASLRSFGQRMCCWGARAAQRTVRTTMLPPAPPPADFLISSISSPGGTHTQPTGETSPISPTSPGGGYAHAVQAQEKLLQFLQLLRRGVRTRGACSGETSPISPTSPGGGTHTRCKLRRNFSNFSNFSGGVYAHVVHAREKLLQFLQLLRRGVRTCGACSGETSPISPTSPEGCTHMALPGGKMPPSNYGCCGTEREAGYHSLYPILDSWLPASRSCAPLPDLFIVFQVWLIMV
ncbi:hypothetical protein HNQ65_001150 [Prosthecobacter vanneervenii]|uniref:Uncharacterized protein n=1 Tax=Prosthecobacter vanneervenii TaxID=48466 RepID=A0A7W7Y8I6_9BACT|nr:hypothetical protein [Prosthecobacter vanneervenii]